MLKMQTLRNLLSGVLSELHFCLYDYELWPYLITGMWLFIVGRKVISVIISLCLYTEFAIETKDVF